MKYTTEYMTKLFHYVNEELFDNMLDIPIMKSLSNTEIYAMVNAGIDVPVFDGICVPSHWEGDCNYFIGIYDGLNENNFFNTFVHELIHIQCMESHSFSGHYGLFRMWTEKAIERFYGNFEDI